jgi:hypothetical protein
LVIALVLFTLFSFPQTAIPEYFIRRETALRSYQWNSQLTAKTILEKIAWEGEFILRSDP